MFVALVFLTRRAAWLSVMRTTPRVTLKFPGPKALDQRIAVTLDEPSTPWPITIYFVHVGDEERDAQALVAIGLELGSRFERSALHEAVELERLPRPVTRADVQRVIDRFGEYVEYARAAITVGGPPQLPPGERRQPDRRELTDAFMQLIADQYREWSAGKGRAVTAIANAHGVNRSTASRWVDAARNRGFLPPKGGR
jgi:hypothetical protein